MGDAPTSDHGAHRVFLDANVLFSAAYKPGSRLHALWDLKGVRLLSSAYAVEEARRNLQQARPARIEELNRLCAQLLLVPEAIADVARMTDTSLASKDLPILAAAIAARATHLLTGDKDHFATLYGKSPGGVLVLSPASYLGEAEPP